MCSAYIILSRDLYVANRSQGMIKMYNAEVLSKFPVVQHFPFGSLFTWEKDPNAKRIQSSVHASSQPKSVSHSSMVPPAGLQPASRNPLAGRTTTTTTTAARNPETSSVVAPWAHSSSGSHQPAHSVHSTPRGPGRPTRAPWSPSPPAPAQSGTGVTAPWVRERQGGNTGAAPETSPDTPSATPAPWANKHPSA